MDLVPKSEYNTCFDTPKTVFLVYGKLNIDYFQPWGRDSRGEVSLYDNSCQDNLFYGYEHIKDEVNNDYHVIMIKNRQIHCMNLKDEDGEHFCILSTRFLGL